MPEVLIAGDDLQSFTTISTLGKILSRGGLKVEDFHWFTTPFYPTWEGETRFREQMTTLKPKCVIAMSITAMRWLVPDCSVSQLNARGYVQWSEPFQVWVICTISPSFIIKGKTSFAQVLLHDIQRGIEVARDGFSYAEVDYTLDCTPSIASKWVDEFEFYLQDHPDLYLSCDIETPFKKDADEEELDPEGNGPRDVSILRCGYSYKDHHGLSLPWDGPFRPIHERLLGMNCTHLWWNAPFDVPHILADGIGIGGSNEDGMLCLHGISKIPLWDGTVKSIKEIVEGKLDVTPIGLDDQGNRIPLKIKEYIHNQDSRPWFQVKNDATRFPIACTNDHKIWTDHGWKRADAVIIGDRIPTKWKGSDSLIHGTILGDGYVTNDGSGTLLVGHSNLKKCQTDWGRHKAEHLGSNVYIVHKGVAIQFSAVVGRSWRAKFYNEEGKKQFVPPCDDAALAVWYCDDGNFHRNAGVKGGGRARFANYIMDMGAILAWFQSRFGVKGVSAHKNGKKNTLNPAKPRPDRPVILKISGKALNAFFEAVAPYIPPCMQYKLREEFRGRYNGWLEQDVPRWGTVERVGPAWDFQRIKGNDKYCLTIDHPTHRFFTLGGLVSNCWHILNSDLKKSLGFVAPFFAHGYPMWKHTSKEQPAFYNCQDAVVAGINMRGTVDLLKKHGLWSVYKEYICDLGPVFSSMTRAGMPIDFEKRKASSIALMEKLRVVQEQIELAVPDAIRVRSPKNGYVRAPIDTTGLTEFTFEGITHEYCPSCHELNPKKIHFKSKLVKNCTICEQKWTKAHVKPKKVEHVCDDAPFIEVETNPCANLTPITKIEGEKRWARIEPFTPSPKGILSYQAYKKIAPIMTGKGKDRRPTTDEKAIKTLMGRYPLDPLFPLVLDDREYSKVGGSYIGYWNETVQAIEGGFPVGVDGRVRGTFTDNPSTLRTSMVNPSLQTLPRGDDSEVQKWVKQMFVAPEGFLFAEADFSGIEAVLVGYHAGSREFMRLAKIDVHSYYTAYNLHRQGILPFSDLPQLSWSDADLKAYGKEVIKKRFEAARNIGKRCIHAADYKASASKLLLEYPLWFKNVKEAQASINIVYDLFPEIQKWHSRICLQVDKSAIIRNSFGHVHRFYQALKWTKKAGEWDWDFGLDACRTIAFAPQSDAAFIGRAALKRMYYNYPDTLGRWLRLFVHDSVITECLKSEVDTSRELMHYEMTKPIVEMPLSPSWNLGEFVQIDVESKQGSTWYEMH